MKVSVIRSESVAADKVLLTYSFLQVFSSMFLVRKGMWRSWSLLYLASSVSKTIISKVCFLLFLLPPGHLVRAVTMRMWTVPNWWRVVSKGEGCGDGDNRITRDISLSVQGRLCTMSLFMKVVLRHGRWTQFCAVGRETAKRSYSRIQGGVP
jgi:hypothetical protein